MAQREGEGEGEEERGLPRVVDALGKTRGVDCVRRKSFLVYYYIYTKTPLVKLACSRKLWAFTGPFKFYGLDQVRKLEPDDHADFSSARNKVFARVGHDEFSSSAKHTNKLHHKDRYFF